MRSILGALVLAASAAPAWAGQWVTVKGTVVDDEGKPVAGADVAPFWDFAGGRATPIDGVKTDASGAFSLSIQNYDRPWAALAIEKGRELAGMVSGEKDGPAGPVEIRLGDWCRIRGTFVIAEGAGKPEWTNVYVSTSGGDVRVAQCDSTKAEFAVILPRGSWSLWMYGSDVLDRTEPVALEKQGLDRDLGAIEFQRTFLAQHYGKELPAWTVTDARGAKKDASLADYRGKWVLIEFWGFW